MLEYVGLPVPGESLMLMLGFSSSGKSLVFSIIMAISGTFIGSMGAYAIGNHYGENIVLKIGKPVHLTKEKLDNTDKLLRKHAVFTIIFSRFVPGVRHVIPYMSGIAKVDVRKNALYNLISAAIWCPVFILIGDVTGSKWNLIGSFVGTYTLAALVLILFVYIVFKFFNRYKITIILFSTLVTAFIFFTSEIMENELSPFDNMIYGYISKFISNDLTIAMKLISNLGSIYVFGVLTVLIMAAFWRKRQYRFYGVMAAINLISVSLLNLLFKTIFHRARPDILQLVYAVGYSFPSGHSMISAAFYGYLIYLCLIFLKRPWKQVLSILQIILILFIGISRIYLGVHYASDVIGGFLVGIAWLVIFMTLSNVIHKKSKPAELKQI